MEQITEKLDATLKCPYCGHEEETVIYANAESSICDGCGAIFNIELWVSSYEIRCTK